MTEGTDTEGHAPGGMVARAARIAGLNSFEPPTLEAVERRRLQLWVMASIVGAVLSTVTGSLMRAASRARAGGLAGLSLATTFSS